MRSLSLKGLASKLTRIRDLAVLDVTPVGEESG